MVVFVLNDRNTHFKFKSRMKLKQNKFIETIRDLFLFNVSKLTMVKILSWKSALYFWDIFMPFSQKGQ